MWNLLDYAACDQQTEVLTGHFDFIAELAFHERLFVASLTSEEAPAATEGAFFSFKRRSGASDQINSLKVKQLSRKTVLMFSAAVYNFMCDSARAEAPVHSTTQALAN